MTGPEVYGAGHLFKKPTYFLWNLMGLGKRIKWCLGSCSLPGEVERSRSFIEGSHNTSLASEVI